MKIVCAGGGPAGLFFAIAMKLAAPEHEISVLERKPNLGAEGWGIVFDEDLLDAVRAVDPHTEREVRAAAYRPRTQSLEIRGDRIEADTAGYTIGRSTLLKILADRALSLGVSMEFGREITSATDIDADVLVAGDGANSRLRRSEPERFGTEVSVSRNHYVWLGTTRIFDTFNFAFVNTHAGWVWCHTYANDEHTSTFIVECAPETWTGLEFDTLSGSASLRVLEEMFADQLDGARLSSRGPGDAPVGWRNFRTVTNDKWHSGNTVLIGDAAHTTHFSMGFGTTLAVLDAIALAAALREQPTAQQAFAAYEDERRLALVQPQAVARASAEWFEDIESYIDRRSAVFFFYLRARRDFVSHAGNLSR